MYRYQIRFVVGPGKINDIPMGASMRKEKVVSASNRAEAYMKSYRDFVDKGYDVTVVKPDNCERPLCLSENEINSIRSAGIPLEEGLPKGVQIEEINKEVEE